MNLAIRKALTLTAVFVGLILLVRYLLPLLAPFLLGAALALAAEPMVHFFCTRLHMKRGIAAGIGVSMAFCFLAMVVLMLCGLLIRELGALAGVLPEVENAVRNGLNSMSDWLLTLASRAPDGIRGLLTQQVTSFSSGSSALLDRVTDFLLRLASGILSHVPDGAVSIGTGIISSFMISAKLPDIRKYIKSRIPFEKLKPLFDALHRIRTALGGWLRAQIKLSGVTFLVTTAGFLLLRIRFAPLLAVVTALVDAFPILGTGTVLLPWSLVCFLQGDHFRAFGLLGVYAAATLTRSVLEPRLVGKHLGLDPLVTLLALYTGYRLFGILGMIFAPMLAVAATQLTSVNPPEA